jgi:hypothetical protein
MTNTKIEVRMKPWAMVLFDVCDWFTNRDLVPFFIFSAINKFVSTRGWQKRVDDGVWEDL